jgi:hypothetical protein
MKINNVVSSVLLGSSLIVSCAQPKEATSLKGDKVVRIDNQGGYLALDVERIKKMAEANGETVDPNLVAKRFAFEKLEDGVTIRVRALHDSNSPVASATEDKNPPVRMRCPCDYFVATIGDDSIHMVAETGYKTDIMFATLISKSTGAQGVLAVVPTGAGEDFQSLMDGEGLESATYTVVEGKGEINLPGDRKYKVDSTVALRLREQNNETDKFYLDAHFKSERSTPDYALELKDGQKKPEICVSCIEYKSELSSYQTYRTIVDTDAKRIVSYSEVFNFNSQSEQIVNFKTLTSAQAESKAAFFSKEFLNWNLED